MAEKSKARVSNVLEDPSTQAIARVYADAFLNAAESAGVDDALEEFQSFLDDVLERNPEFQKILLSGIINRDEKISIISRVVGQFGSKFFANFLRTLARHDRLDLLSVIFNESQLKSEERAGKRRVQITSAVQLSDKILDEIRQKLGTTLPFEPILEPTVDATLIGGMVIQIGDTVYDSSLRTRMKQLRVRLGQRSLHEIQSGRNRFSHPEGD